MRRAAVKNIDLDDMDFESRLVSIEEKGGRAHGYKMAREGISAIEDYAAKERAANFKKWKSPALFLSPATNAHGNGRLNPRVINTVFNEVCSLAGVEGHTSHDARHAIGRHLIEKSGISPQFKNRSVTPTRPIPSSTPGSPTRN
jgi:site-specific recombinase XerD